MKKYYKANHPLRPRFPFMLRELFRDREARLGNMPYHQRERASFSTEYMGKILLTLFFILSPYTLKAPGTSRLIIPVHEPVNPFVELMYATAMVETMGNEFAYNETENAVGIFQIRQIRIDDYNRLTGSNFSLDDMFDRENSEKVFLFFASQIGPYNLEKIAKRWNGSGPGTEIYWKQILAWLSNQKT
ncbi:MAG: hypothetical protein RBT38_12995 [Bacteroidales bacterium]|nr:hypothetical protein [Bacteroidales bacterium]